MTLLYSNSQAFIFIIIIIIIFLSVFSLQMGMMGEYG